MHVTHKSIGKEGERVFFVAVVSLIYIPFMIIYNKKMRLWKTCVIDDDAMEYGSMGKRWKRKKGFFITAY